MKWFDKYVFQVFDFCFLYRCFGSIIFYFVWGRKESKFLFDALADLIESLLYSPRNLWC